MNIYTKEEWTIQQDLPYALAPKFKLRFSSKEEAEEGIKRIIKRLEFYLQLKKDGTSKVGDHTVESLEKEIRDAKQLKVVRL